MKQEVSVVIPCRDLDWYLSEALQSALSQDVDSEVIVVDAGSEPPLRLPSCAAGDPRVRLVRSEVPLTGGAARNLGCASSSASWISFLDADDLWEPGSRRALLEACEQEGAELGFGMMTSFRHGEGSERLAVPERRVGVIAGATLMSRRAWEATGPFDETLRAGEYIEWFNRFRLTGLRHTTIDVDVLRRRLHVASTTARQLADAGDRADYLDVVRRWMSRTG